MEIARGMDVQSTIEYPYFYKEIRGKIFPKNSVQQSIFTERVILINYSTSLT